MREVLADATALFEEGFDRSGDFGGFGVKAKVLVNAGGQIEDRLEQWTALGKRRPGVRRERRLGGNTGGVENELVRFQTFGGVIAGQCVADRFPRCRVGEDGRGHGLHFEFAGGFDAHPVVRFWQGE